MKRPRTRHPQADSTEKEHKPRKQRCGRVQRQVQPATEEHVGDHPEADDGCDDDEYNEDEDDLAQDPMQQAHTGTADTVQYGSHQQLSPEVPLSAAELRQSAITQLCLLTGLQQEAAARALDETSEHQADQAVWLEEAQVWLATNNEVEAEVQDLRLAMAESLQEAEARKVAEAIPLDQQPSPQLWERFFGTHLLRALARHVCTRALFSDAAAADARADEGAGGSSSSSSVGGTGLKAPLVRLLQMEHKCCRWFPCQGTHKYFTQLSQELLNLALPTGSASAGQADQPQEAYWISCADADCPSCSPAPGAGACPGPSTSAGAGPSTSAGSGPSTSAGAGPSTSAGAGPSTSCSRQPPSAPAGCTVVCATAPGAAAALGRLAQACSSREQAIAAEVYKMPNVPGQVPELFQDLEPAAGKGPGALDEDEVAVVELCGKGGPEVAKEVMVL